MSVSYNSQHDLISFTAESFKGSGTVPIKDLDSIHFPAGWRALSMRCNNLIECRTPNFDKPAPTFRQHPKQSMFLETFSASRLQI